MSIELIRVDDRLIHGQVVTQWLPYIRANTILIIDDGVAGDAFLAAVNTGLAPADVDVHVLSLEQSERELGTYINDKDKKTLILVKTPLTVLRLMEAGYQFKQLIIGGMGMREGRSRLYKSIAADEGEREAMRRLLERGVSVMCHIVPDDSAVDVQKLI